jgi:hypothetical protein
MGAPVMGVDVRRGGGMLYRAPVVYSMGLRARSWVLVVLVVG